MDCICNNWEEFKLGSSRACCSGIFQQTTLQLVPLYLVQSKWDRTASFTESLLRPWNRRFTAVAIILFNGEAPGTLSTGCAQAQRFKKIGRIFRNIARRGEAIFFVRETLSWGDKLYILSRWTCWLKRPAHENIFLCFTFSRQVKKLTERETKKINKPNLGVLATNNRVANKLSNERREIYFLPAWFFLSWETFNHNSGPIQMSS